MWIYADSKNKIQGYCSYNMSGNTGWQDVSGDVPKVLTNEHGVPLYELVDGQIAARSQADVAADDGGLETMPPLESRIGVLEEALDMILTGVTE